MVTLLPLLACGLTGCNWSATTLALENPASTRTEVAKPVEATPEPAPASEASSPEPAAQSLPEVPESPTQAVIDPAQLVGTWQDSFYGKRTLTLNADGTAHMRLDLDFAGRLLYGKHLDFDMRWSLDQSTVSIEILGGHPHRAAQSLMDTWGTEHTYLLDRVECDRVEMRDKNQSTSHVLQRLP